jgi:hypothetical protein
VTLFTQPCDENESNQIRNCLDELGIWIDGSGLQFRFLDSEKCNRFSIAAIAVLRATELTTPKLPFSIWAERQASLTATGILVCQQLSQLVGAIAQRRLEND